MVSYDVNNLATEIFTYEFDSDTGYTPLSSVSGWLANNIGMFNNRLFTTFEVSGNYFAPTGSFQQEERSVYKQMYLYEFYTKKTRQVLRGIDSSVDFITLREGDSTITRTNKNEIAKTYRGLANDANEELEKLVTSYNMYQAEPVQVAGEDGLYVGSGTYSYVY